MVDRVRGGKLRAGLAGSVAVLIGALSAVPQPALADPGVTSSAPAPPGAIVSTDYPPSAFRGGVGLVGEFEVTAPAVDPEQVVEYAWTFDSGVYPPTETVLARPTDHGATIVAAPPRDGIVTLYVWSKDAAGRYSTARASYTFLVRADPHPVQWTFEETGGETADLSGYGNILYLAGGATRVPGRSGVGSALALNGTTGYAATTVGAPQYPDPWGDGLIPMSTEASFTVAARVRLDATGGTGRGTIIAANGGRSFAYDLGYSGPDDRWYFRMAAADVDDPTVYTVLSDAAPTAERWTHLAGVYDATTETLALYVNGVAQATTASRADGFAATAGVTVGKHRWNGADAGFLAGAVDDVRIYRAAVGSATLAPLAAPLPPTISFPNGSTVPPGATTLVVTFDSGGDTNVTTYWYGRDINTSLAVSPAVPGGSATVTLATGTVAGEFSLFARAVDDGARASQLTQGYFQVERETELRGTVWDGDTWLPAAGAVVTLEPGGYQLTTGLDGEYVFTGMPAGSYTLTATHGGPCGKTDTRTVTLSNGSQRRADLYLFPYAGDPDECP
jgi:hypothetical protein